MAKLITEDNIEQAILEYLDKNKFGYDIVRCDPNPNKKEDLNDGTGRTNKKQCVLPELLKESIARINPDIAPEYLNSTINELCQDYSGQDMIDANYKLYNLIRNTKKITPIVNGKEELYFIKLIDFDNPSNNTFTAVSQMWIQGRYNWRRPDILIFVNGMPLVFIELKNSTVKVREAYDKNLTDYKKDIPNLFAFNQICVLSNALETRLGAFNSKYDEHFFEWLKVNSEKEPVDRKTIREKGSSIVYFIEGLLRCERLLDYIENFIMFSNKKIKIIAKNHQFFGVNNLFEAVKNREALNGKLGVFWHTQGSGKSYSMVMLVRKVRKKLEGNFTFLVITDRDDLDTQIHKNFVRTEVIGEHDECQPKSSEQLRDYLTKNKDFIFTLIHKFRYDKNKQFPVLSERNDIIVLVDEAHRTQYKDLAENMRTALPNANFVAFTGTPLLGSKRLTNQWFGDYVSEYNFAQSVEDGSTVPIFFNKRVPEVWLTNDFLDDDVVTIIEDEDLNEDEVRQLENSESKILEVIKRDDRLDKIAKDIAHHFPRRGFLGKGMVVSVDKFTAVKMYDKVQYYWNEEKKNIIEERNHAETEEKRNELTKMLDYMNNVEMAVIVSEDANEKEKFEAAGLDITKHRQKMNELVDGVDIEDRFKDPNDKLQLVFVCAMWLTGFDVNNLSTLYLDKPMKSHTLMQAIARTNRKFEGKSCGFIVDYINVFKYIKKALAEYATGDDGLLPAKDVEYLIKMLESTIDEGNDYLRELGIDLDDIANTEDTLERLEKSRKALDIIVDKDDYKDRFKVITNTMINLYEASKPEIFELGWRNERFMVLDYIHGLLHNTIDDEKIKRAKARMDQLLDSSVESNTLRETSEEYVIHEGKVIDLSKIDAEKLKEEIRQAEYKAIEIDDLKEYLDKALKEMTDKNCTRIAFSERFKNIIDAYNAGGMQNEEYYEQLLKFVDDIKNEQNRANTEGLTEEELEIFDLLVKDKKLTKAEEQKVKLAAKNLYIKLTTERDNLLVVDWYKDEQPKLKVKSAIEDSLDGDLPEAYDRVTFSSKVTILLNHFIDMAVQAYGWIANKVA